MPDWAPSAPDTPSGYTPYAPAPITVSTARDIIIDALNTLEAVVAVIPFVAVYSPLIDVLVAGIEAIINYFNPPSVALKVARNDPHRGRVQLIAPHFLQSHQAAFAAQWDTAAESAGLVAAKIQ